MLDYENIEVKDLPPSPMSSPTLVGIESGAFTKLGELEAELEGVKAELDASRANADDWHKRHTSMYNALGEMQDRLKGILTELVNSGSIEKEYAKTIADHCGIEVTRYIGVSGNITFSANVEVSVFDEDDLDTYSFSASYLSLEYQGEDVIDLNYDIEHVEEDYS
jgi:hypothetical protein